MHFDFLSIDCYRIRKSARFCAAICWEILIFYFTIASLVLAALDSVII